MTLRATSHEEGYQDRNRGSRGPVRVLCTIDSLRVSRESFLLLPLPLSQLQLLRDHRSVTERLRIHHLQFLRLWRGSSAQPLVCSCNSDGHGPVPTYHQRIEKVTVPLQSIRPDQQSTATVEERRGSVRPAQASILRRPS